MRMLLALVMLVGCGTSAAPAGAVCSNNSDCDSNLMCLDVAQFSGSACTVIGKSCSKTCSTDPDCTSLGSNFHCFAGCGSDKFCGATP